MLQSNAPPQSWNASIPQGSAAQYAFTFTALTGGPYPFDDTTWEYVVRPLSGTGSPLMTITETPSEDGSLTATSTEELSQVTLVLNPAATQDIPVGAYTHAIWMNPGEETAYLWLTGDLQVNPAPQP